MPPKDYSKLRGRTREKGYSQREVAVSLGISPTTYSLKLNGKYPFTQCELYGIIKLLDIPPEEISNYFFSNKSLEKINICAEK